MTLWSGTCCVSAGVLGKRKERRGRERETDRQTDKQTDRQREKKKKERKQRRLCVCVWGGGGGGENARSVFIPRETTLGVFVF